MAVNLISLKCPECGAALKIEKGRKQCFCSYCGARILLDNDHEYIYREINEAEIKRAEVSRELELKRLEMIEKHNAAVARRKHNRIVFSIVLIAIGLAITFIGMAAGKASGDSDSGWYMGSAFGLLAIIGGVCAVVSIFESNKDDDEMLDFSEQVKVPRGVNDFQQKHYEAIEKAMKKAGFTDVSCVPLSDLKLGLLKTPGLVQSITINGNEIEGGGKKFSKDASVVITYHSFPE